VAVAGVIGITALLHMRAGRSSSKRAAVARFLP
jgi:hypothetical protein